MHPRETPGLATIVERVECVEHRWMKELTRCRQLPDRGHQPSPLVRRYRKMPKPGTQLVVGDICMRDSDIPRAEGEEVDLMTPVDQSRDLRQDEGIRDLWKSGK